MEKILYLNELDTEGNLTGETSVITLSFDTIMEIVDAARCLAIQYRQGTLSQVDLEHQLSNLHASLDEHGLVSPAPAARTTGRHLG